MSHPESLPAAELQARLRAACAALVEFQRQGPAPAPFDPAGLAAGLRAFFDRFTPATATERERQAWQQLQARLVEDAALPPQVARRDGRGAASIAHDLAALLRPPHEAYDEADELDWAVRYWEQARQAGLLDEDLASDFGELWRRVEWSGLAQHLTLLAAGHAEERRLLAYAVKVASRYGEMAPLKRLLEQRWPELFDAGFTLR
jgi:aminoglycoside/choline kinase family phosphotransferase